METILIIEDNLDIRENTSELLSINGYNVTTATAAEPGIAIAKELIPDVILCDILLPFRNGYYVLEELKKDVRTAAIPVIFTTTLIDKNGLDGGLKAGARDYLIKPFSEEELLGCISSSNTPA